MLVSSLFSIDEEGNGINDYARITDVEYKAEVIDEPNNGGKIRVTERLTFDIHAASKDNLFWELWRDLPESYEDGLKIDYKVNYVKQINDNGQEIIYEESPKLYWDDYDYISPNYGPGKWYHSPGPYDDYNNYECVFFYVNGLYREEVTFELQYEMNNAAIRYGDVSELYVTMYSEETIKYLESFKAEILIPDKDMPRDGNYEAYTYGTNNNEFEYEESKTRNPGYHTFYIDLDEDDLQFRPYNQYLEFTLWSYGSDKYSFTDYAPINESYYDNEVLEYLRNEKEAYDNEIKDAKENKKQMIIFSSIFSVIILALGLNKIRKIKQKNTFYKPTQDYIYFREIPEDLDPYFAANIVFSKDKKKPDDGNGYSAALLSLVRKNYVELNRGTPNLPWNQVNTNIILKYRSPSLNKNNSPEVLPELKSYNVFTSASSSVKPLFNTMAGTDYNSVTERNKYISSNYNHPVIQDTNGVLGNTQNTSVNVNNVINATTDINQNDTTVPVDRYNIDNKKLESLTPTEAAYYNLLIRHSSDYIINMAIFNQKVERDYDNTDSFVRVYENVTVNEGVNKGYFQRANYTKVKDEVNSSGNRNIILGILIMIIANLIIYPTRLDLAYGSFFLIGGAFIITGLYYKKKAPKLILFTQDGEDAYSKWRGLYNFLNSMTLMNERTVVDLPLWEKYLVYATAFGISEKVVKALEIRCPDLQASAMLNSGYYRSSSFRSSGRSFRSSTRNASSASRYGGGGGYGGGGRGGGGGGGGH